MVAQLDIMCSFFFAIARCHFVRRGSLHVTQKLLIISCWAVTRQVSRGLHGSALRAGLHRRRSKPRCLSVRLRIRQADTPQNLQPPPRPGRYTFEAFIFDADGRLCFTARGIASQLRLSRSADSATQPPRGLSPTASARVAPASRLSRA